jgi:hypothetical protein
MWPPRQLWLGQNWPEAKTTKGAILRDGFVFYFVRGPKSQLLETYGAKTAIMPKNFFTIIKKWGGIKLHRGNVTPLNIVLLNAYFKFDSWIVCLYHIDHSRKFLRKSKIIWYAIEIQRDLQCSIKVHKPLILMYLNNIRNDFRFS